MRRRLGGLALTGLIASVAVTGCASDDSSTSTTGAASTSVAPSTSAAATTSAGPVETSAPAPISGADDQSGPSTTSPPSSPADDGENADVDAPDTAAELQPMPTNIDETIAEFVESNQLNGAGLVLVDAEDGVVSEQYWGEFDADRVSLIASSSKMITATVLLGLAGDGVVDLDTPIANQVEWAPDLTDVTIADLVSSTSGLVGLGPDPAYAPYVCQFLAEGTISDCGKQIATTPDDDADVVPPETEFRYGGAQWQLAGAIAVDKSKMSWDELLEKYLREPCGVDSLGYSNHWAEFNAGFDYPPQFDGDVADLPVTDNPNMEGGAYIDPVDYAALIRLHLNEGTCGGEQPIPAELIERARVDRLAEVGVDADFGYGFGWWVDLDDDTVSDPGAFGSVGWFDPSGDYGAYLVIEATGSIGEEMFDAVQPDIAAFFEQR